MTATTTEKKARAIVIMRVVNGNVEHEMSKTAIDKLKNARQLCNALDAVPDWQNESRGASDAIQALLEKIASST